MVSRWSLLLFAAWTTAVVSYWWAAVPLRPTRSIPHDGSRSLLRVPSENEIGICRYSGTRKAKTGPIEIWKVNESRVARTLLSADDEVILNNRSNPLGRPSDQYVLARRDGRLSLTNLVTGQLIGKFDYVPEIEDFLVNEERREIYISDRFTRLTCFRFGQTQPVWSVPEATLYGLVPGELQSVMLWNTRQKANGWSRRPVGPALINLSTGELDRRFDHVGGTLVLQLSHDAATAILPLPNSQIGVFDVATTQLRTKIPHVAGAYFSIASDGRELIFWKNGERGPSVVQRNSLTDGSPSEGPATVEAPGFPVPVNAEFVVRGLIVQEKSQLFLLIAKFNSLLARWGLGGLAISYHEPPRLEHVPSGRSLGALPYGSQFQFVGNSRKLVGLTPTHLHIYELPPRRNYEWLVPWIHLPPLALLVLLKLLRRVRARHRWPVLPQAGTAEG